MYKAMRTVSRDTQLSEPAADMLAMPISGPERHRIILAAGSIEPDGYLRAALGGQDGDDLKRVGIDDDNLIADQEV